jgi:hypothetical protein
MLLAVRWTAVDVVGGVPGAVMEVVFEGRLYVDYMQAYVLPLEGDADAGPDGAFEGQVNGLLGRHVRVACT